MFLCMLMSMYGVPYAPLERGPGDGAKQSMRDECDINLIVARFAETGLMTHLADGIPQFMDVSELGDYRSVIEQVRKVDDYFAGLPAEVRSVFDNNPASFMDFLETGASDEDLKKLGLDEVFSRRNERKRRAEDALQAADEAPVVEGPMGPPEPPEEASTVVT